MYLETTLQHHIFKSLHLSRKARSERPLAHNITKPSTRSNLTIWLWKQNHRVAVFITFRTKRKFLENRNEFNWDFVKKLYFHRTMKWVDSGSLHFDNFFPWLVRSIALIVIVSATYSHLGLETVEKEFSKVKLECTPTGTHFSFADLADLDHIRLIHGSRR